ncbi:hypothetical protein D4764_07G0000480 [Takifugu flavidus]|uniref:Uncharacterized protein n=1 Tax=Takifugu flavidus TaxID=433684 RepID=A0A5C6MR96_9TELE|nr:hypothetical protein D4764_07G0000480 [Takifugu flavidus]
MLVRFATVPSVKRRQGSIRTSKSESMVLTQKKVECLLWVRKEVLPQVEEFKYLGILFTSEGSMERGIDRRFGIGICSDAGLCVGAFCLSFVFLVFSLGAWWIHLGTIHW